MIYVDNFFKRARPDEELFEASNDFTTVQTLANSFYYHVKGNECIDKDCATDKQRERYKRQALKAADPIDFLEDNKMMPVQSAIKELELLPTH
ncbi:hypothetical protein OPW07_24255 [Vibrio europaeus]|uniref:hypothetical protein n=1 Tax=Vibrio europaeus TaxID=300876 RepID=UPI0018A74A20|nr:hypothetical protein [Vibrio europaeus]MDC5812837.1 hypothetical protein [Vibrio europaeus]QPG37631.1 hypothetical protein IXK98_15090 [Vibrio europaeus]